MMRATIVGLMLVAVLGAEGKGQGQAIESIPSDAFIDWSLHNNAGWQAIYRGELRLAEQHFARAIEVLKPHYKNDPRLLARSYHDLAWVLHREGRSKEALPLALWSFQAREAKLGVGAEPVAQSLSILGAIESGLGQLDQAETHLARAISIYEIRDGGDSARVADLLIDLSRVQIARRKLGQAETGMRRVLAVPANVLSGIDPGRIAALKGLAQIEEIRGNPRAALEHLRKVDAIYELLTPPDPDGRAEVEMLIKELEKKITTEKPSNEKRPLPKMREV